MWPDPCDVLFSFIAVTEISFRGHFHWLGVTENKEWIRNCIHGIMWDVITYQCQQRLLCIISLQWRHNGRDGVSNHQPCHCLLNLLFRRIWRKTSILRVTGLCAGNSPVTGELPAQRANNAGSASIWWRHHVMCYMLDVSAVIAYLYPDLIVGLDNPSNETDISHCIPLPCWSSK